MSAQGEGRAVAMSQFSWLHNLSPESQWPGMRTVRGSFNGLKVTSYTGSALETVACERGHKVILFLTHWELVSQSC